MLAELDLFEKEDVQLIWQTGKFYYKSILEKTHGKVHKNVCIVEFLNRMDLAYAAADVIISRAGAGTIAELCVVAKPVILVPSPNVAEDHQTQNAMALVKRNAAVLITDQEAEGTLGSLAVSLIRDEQKCAELKANIASLALPDADNVIAKEVLIIAK